MVAPCDIIRWNALIRAAELTIKLNGKEYQLTKYPNQGSSGAPVYTVASGPYKGDFAKTGYSEDEEKATALVSDLHTFAPISH